MSDLVGNTNCWFSHAKVHLIKKVKDCTIDVLFLTAKTKVLITCAATVA